MVGLLLKKKPDVTNRWKNPTTATYFRGIGADGKVGEIEVKISVTMATAYTDMIPATALKLFELILDVGGHS